MDRDADRMRRHTSLLDEEIKGQMDEKYFDIRKELQGLLLKDRSRQDKKMEIKKQDKANDKRFKSMERKMDRGFSMVLDRLENMQKRMKIDERSCSPLVDHAAPHKGKDKQVRRSREDYEDNSSSSSSEDDDDDAVLPYLDHEAYEA
ncbi:hypothetical protein CDL15_Pgr023640 [Punica granatum]|uniref:Uncharacterized protein n=1 Tax=Punica granatum TaxID=22663 RepID=A0A218W7A9_PUNGR|nr:hypothetical protein CDL15_Pgr023640 [Punica granatum]